MNIVGIIQARMTSTRLPGKVLLDIAGEPMLVRVVSRLERATAIDSIVIATTTDSRDDVLVELCQRHGWRCFRGSREDVLARYFFAAREAVADAIVRVTSDCPLIDGQVVDQVVAAFNGQRADYASNTLVRTFPRGLDAEVIRIDALEQAMTSATEPHQREHVTPFLYQNPQQFKLSSVTAERDYSQHRWTVDTADDLQLVRAIVSRLGAEGLFGWRDVLALIDREPSLADLNAQVRQKALCEG